MAAVVLFCFLRGGGRWSGAIVARRTTWPVVTLAAYVGAVTIFWTGRLGETPLLRHPAFYAFNVLALLAFVKSYLHQGPVFLRTIGYAFCLSAAVQAGLTFAGYQAGVRETASFNNPNQLGYFALLAASVVTLAQMRFGICWFIAGIGLACCLWLAAVSLSKAALAGVVVLLALLMKARPSLIAVTCLLVYSAAQVVDLTPLVASVSDRVAQIGVDSDDSFEGRGYDRIWKSPEHLLLGAGEGANYRFGRGIEIHSSFGTLLFCYGVPGFLLFCGFLYKVYRLSGLRSFQFLLPALAYGVTHQGLRFTEFWLLLAFVLCSGIEGRAKGAETIRRAAAAGRRVLRIRGAPRRRYATI